MAKRKGTNYFELLRGLSEFCKKSSEEFLKNTENYDIQTLSEVNKSIHQIEHEADEAQHEYITKLLREFITPVEREDFFELAQITDDITDYIEDVSIKLYMFNIGSITDEGLAFAKLIDESTECLCRIMDEFCKFPKCANIKPLVIEMSELENRGDAMYSEAVHKLFVNTKDTATLFAWTEVYKSLERCCDACEHAAKAVERVIIKNT